MVHHRSGQIQSGWNGSRRLACLILVLLLGVLLAVYAVIHSDRPETSMSGLTAVIAPLVSGRPAAHPQLGYVAHAETSPVSTPAGLGFAPPAVQPTVEPTVAPTPTRMPNRFRVAMTNGLGLALHTAPSNAARLPQALVEGAQVTVLERLRTGCTKVSSPTRLSRQSSSDHQGVTAL